MPCILLPIQILRKVLYLLFQTGCLLFYGFCFAIIVASLMKIKRIAMKNIIVTFLVFLITLTAVHAQKGIDFSLTYPAGGRILMCVDSSARNIVYDNVFPNQPNTSFSYLPEVSNVSLQIYFKKKDPVSDFRYTILVDDKPIVVNKSIDEKLLKNLDRGDEGILRFTTLGIFPLKGKTVTILVYSVERPLYIQKSVLYGRPIPRAKIKLLAKRFATDKGVDYDRITAPKEHVNLALNEKDDELTAVKDKSAIDYLYGISIKDKQTGKMVFESAAWQYGGYVDDIDGYDFHLPYVTIDKSVFKESGSYEIIIQPLINWDSCLDCDFSPDEIEKYTTRHTLSVSLDKQSYTAGELGKYIGISCSLLGVSVGLIMVYIKQRNKKLLAEKDAQKNVAKLQLNSIRAQLNPHFLFNALSGIQNLMNNKEIDNANRYLAKFARLTRNVLDGKELISLSQEWKLLDDYLQMEQLRFGFQYEINYSETLDLDNTEIPSMLLQPFIENAVKHGIAKKPSDGKVLVNFIKQAKDLLLTVSDNGNGFDTAKKRDGLGLLLSERRIDLLNNMYKENSFILAVQSNANGTEISLTLKDWL